MKKPKLIVIVGPTGAGKSALGVFLARKFNGEIISADSRQVYKGLDIGSAKITKKEMRGIPHHLLDVASPRGTFTASQYKKRAQKKIEEIHSRDCIPFLVGGTGFYVDAVVYNMDFPSVPPSKKLRARLEKKSVTELFALLEKKDAERALQIDPHNKQRLIRALEVVDALGKVPTLGKRKTYDTLTLGTYVSDWEAHDAYLLKRLKQRLRKGMVKEVERLHKDKKVSWKRMRDLGLEYRWVARYLQKEVDYDEMVENLWVDIRQYARRQMTWFKRDKDIKWVVNKEEAEEIVEKFII